jgi:pre-mRNA-splicing factor SYF1
LQVPEADAKPLYLQYAKLEEDYGLARHALAVYDRATKAVPDHEKVNVYEIYIARASAFFGVSRTREIYEVCFWPFLPCQLRDPGKPLVCSHCCGF